MEIILKNTSLKFKTSDGKTMLNPMIDTLERAIQTTNVNTGYTSCIGLTGCNLAKVDVTSLVGKTIHLTFSGTYGKVTPGGSSPGLIPYAFFYKNGQTATNKYHWENSPRATPIPTTEASTYDVNIVDDTITVPEIELPEGETLYLGISTVYGSQVGDDVSENVAVWYIDN